MKIRQLMLIGCTALGILINVPDVHAADVVSLNVTGNIVAAPCQVGSDSKNIVVNLGDDIQASSLQTSGNATSWADFYVYLVNCPAGTASAKMLFQGTAYAASPDDMYINTGTAGNLAVQLQGFGGEPLGDGKTITGSIVNNAYAFHLKARAITQSGGVTPGTIRSTVTATLTYQ